MKKFFLICTLVFGAALYAENNTIAVPAPKSVNLSAENGWIPLFIQGVITSNLQQYSGMKVIDRQNADMVKAEQKLSERAEFDEKNAIALGKMTNARLIVTGSITGKGAGCALLFSITDAETGETKATATVPNCLFSALENGEAANRISYDLMTGYGIALSADVKNKLTQKADVMTAETSAQASVAKGIIAEQGGLNIEALTYYIQARKNDKKFSEAARRAASMTTVVVGGNFGAYAKNLIKLRNDWDNLLRETAKLMASNEPTFAVKYYSDITPGAIDYNKGIMAIGISAPYLYQDNFVDWYDENQKIEEELLSALRKIPESKDWGEKINNFPWSYADDTGGNNWMQRQNVFRKYVFDVSLHDANKKVIAKKRIRFDVSSFFPERKKFLIENSLENDEELGEIIFPVSVNDADTDSLFISIASAGANGKDVSIIPLPADVLSPAKALKAVKNEEFKGTLKIGCAPAFFHINRMYGDSIKYGYENEFFLEIKNIKKATLDLSEMISLRDIPDNCNIHYFEIENLILPETIFYIGSESLGRCNELKTLTVPKSLRIIGDDAFTDYSWLRIIHYAGTKDDWKKITIGKQNRALDRVKIKYNYKKNN